MWEQAAEPSLLHPVYQSVIRWGRVEVGSSFLLLLAWMNYLDTQSIVLLALAACLCHELGHYLALRAVGNDVRLLRLTGIGAEMLPLRPMSYGQEFFAVAAGPLTNLLLAAVSAQWEGGALFSGLNLVLGSFNLLPISRLDGGRLIKCLCSMLSGPDRAARISAYLDLGLAGLLLILGCVLARSAGNLTLLTVSIWLILPYFNGKERKKGLPDGTKTGKIR